MLLPAESIIAPPGWTVMPRLACKKLVELARACRVPPLKLNAPL